MSESKVTCLICRHLATDHTQQGLAPCNKWLGPNPTSGLVEYDPKVGPPHYRCPCPNFVIDMRSVPDEITHSELDKKCFEFFETVGIIAEDFKRIADILEEKFK